MHHVLAILVPTLLETTCFHHICITPHNSKFCTLSQCDFGNIIQIQKSLTSQEYRQQAEMNMNMPITDF